MNDDPEQVDVLYGKCIDKSDRLQAISDLVVDELEAEGLLDRQYSKVKLHATLMNSLFKVKDDEENSRRITFNARTILEVTPKKYYYQSPKSYPALFIHSFSEMERLQFWVAIHRCFTFVAKVFYFFLWFLRGNS